MATRDEGAYHGGNSQLRFGSRCRVAAAALGEMPNRQRPAARLVQPLDPSLSLRTQTMSIAPLKATGLRDWAIGLRDGLTRERLVCTASLVLAAAAYVPLLAQYAAELWATPGYRLAPVILILAAVAARQRLRMLQHVEPARWASGLAGGLAAAMLALAVVANSPEMAASSLLALCIAAALRWGGLPAARVVLGPWFLACLMLRLPADIDLLGFQTVAGLTVAIAHRVLDALGVLHDVDGLSIVLPTARLWFDSAQSSVFSPWSGVAIVLGVCVWMRRSWIDGLLMFFAGCGWFVLVDVLRIVATVVLSGVLNTPMTGGIAAGALDFGAVVLMLTLVMSSDHVGLLFGTALRLARPVRRARSTKKAGLPPLTVTVTGVTLDANGQLNKVVSQYVPESLTPSPWPPETTAAIAGRSALRAEWPLLATVYGLLCLAQVVWLPSASDAATGRVALAASALRLEMPDESAGWQLEKSATARPDSRGPESIDESAGALVCWLYRRGDLAFRLSLRSRGSAWQGAAEVWKDRGWQLDPRQRPSGDAPSATPAIACREACLSKPYQPGYVCIWESRWDPDGRFWSAPQGGWSAATAAIGRRVQQIYLPAESFGRAADGDRLASAGQTDVQGVLCSYRPLKQDDLAAGRELFDRLATMLERGIAPGAEGRP